MMHWLEQLRWQQTEPVQSKPHRDNAKRSRNYPLDGECPRCGASAPANHDGQVRAHRRKARTRIKHYQATGRAARRCVQGQQ